jgi:drug/metabolite transporter (DMT)-like permease
VTTPSILAPRVLIPFIVVTLIWGSTWIVIRDQLGVVPPSWSVTYRFLLAGLIMLGFALAKGQSLRLTRDQIVFTIVMGVMQFSVNFNLVYRAEHYITSGLVAVVFALLVVPNAIFARVFLGQKMQRAFVIGSCVAFSGLILLFIHEARRDPGNTSATLLGVSFTIAGVVSASIANVMQATERARTMDMPVLLGWGMLWATIANTVVALAISGPPVMDLRIGYLAGVAYLGIFASAVAFTLYFGIIRTIGPAKAAYSSVIIPILAMIISTFAEGYRWSLLAGAGCVIALAGLVIALSARRPVAKSG